MISILRDTCPGSDLSRRTVELQSNSFIDDLYSRGGFSESALLPTQSSIRDSRLTGVTHAMASSQFGTERLMTPLICPAIESRVETTLQQMSLMDDRTE